MALNIDAKPEWKNDLWFQKWHEVFQTFSLEHSQKVDFNGILLSKVENIWA